MCPYGIRHDFVLTVARILWSVSDLCWQLIHSNEDHTVVLGNSKPFKELEKPKETMTWILSSLGDQTIPAKVKPGIYSLRNKASGTFVALAPDEKRLGCWSPSHFKNEDTKLWEVKPLGDGYTIRLLGTDKYCTLQNGSINVSTCPAAWKIVRNDSPVHTTDEWFQIYWADSELTWDLDRYGKATPGNTISLVKQDKYQECRLFTFSL
ncbi:hypothetical protein BDW22DRAFT_197304 [Trametopsis cervina]|nr:hypothetical protein BDW22DRAFT_197304 [Trametopsis cervina]